MSPSQIIVLATPAFFALIALEYAVGRARGRNTYRLDDAVTSIGLGMLSQVSAVFTRLLRFGIYTAVYSLVALTPDSGFWTTWSGWLLALVFYDFCYYWHHRLGHTCSLFWAAHVVHHQSQDYNLSTALRQTSSGALFGWVFYLPMALAGVPPLVFGVVALVDLLYQYWIHTQQIGKLGWFDRVFASPSNHRVHHAVNDRYLDKNYGGILILWDRLFGSYADEDDREPCVYGTRSPLNSWDPLWANAEVYADLARDSWHTRRWADKLRVWFRPPGWRPADVSQRFPKPAFDIGQVRAFAPPLSPNVQRFAAWQFITLLAGSGAYLWLTDSWPLWQSAVWLVVLLAGLWSVGAVMQGRIGMGEALMIECAALSMATAATGLVDLHRLFKPLTMGFALMVVAQAGLVARNGGQSSTRGIGWLLTALAASLAGDAFLMFDGFFLPGLLAFLLAHLAYIALLRQDAPWLAARRAALVIALVGLAVFVLLWIGGLPAALRVPVAVYVLAIAVMASWAVSRATVLADGPAWAVAVGAISFLISDATLAVNRFVMPLPHFAVWVLTTYYAAQCLMVMGWLRGRPARRASSRADQGA
ncbi:lysoplasmalogenase family protein [Hydrogenophaga sp.]|uniref:lysoplasmalogenase family protein n=1 Tax=Hydrogenophaga sp. TaxID=1904254 RepID=UPI002625E4D1|nr:lysoplasmalogenase family protein [Hydrogenophaga sp.]MDM7950945.1 lysoplasmalogenase family protein [Hydrogenophaga sp.]